MPRYFFHMQDGTTVLDPDGLELADLKAAQEEAIRACGEMLRDIPDSVKNEELFRLWVTDQPEGEGKRVFTVTVATEKE